MGWKVVFAHAFTALGDAPATKLQSQLQRVEGAQHESDFLGWLLALPPASSQAVAAAAGKPRDKHSMPVYAFADRTRTSEMNIVRQRLDLVSVAKL